MFIRKKILIVDGQEMDRQFLRHILTNASYTVHIASDRQQALDFLNEESFDTFIVDIHLPDMEGIKFIRQLHESKNYHATPILAITTANVEAIRQKGETLGITDWIKKPISPPKLLNMLRKMGITNQHQFQSLA